ncbi:MAG: DUF4321 domain-containing protein [Bacillota bacterium]
MRTPRTSGNPWLLVALIVIGGLAGSALGDSLAGAVPFLKNASHLGFGPAIINLEFLSFTVGFSMVMGPLTVLGFIVGYLAYRRL